MTKRNKIIYWIATIWLALGMLSTGIVQLLKIEDEVTKITQLGYPVYILTILGIWKILGVMVVLLPKMPVVKEWAYAGFFFTMTGAVVSHFVSGSPAGELFGPALLIVLTVLSWYFRPKSRKTNQLKTISNEQ
ncbi:DoxX family protein [Flavobacterium sp.]|uniref:DoxX family protein n=1 Tax=Flavobacterium sp. TaxID=239 RepID=UPI003A8F49D4